MMSKMRVWIFVDGLPVQHLRVGEELNVKCLGIYLQPHYAPSMSKDLNFFMIALLLPL